MIFNIRLSLAEFDKLKRPERNCILISDTILVLESGPEVITKGISKLYGDISYFLEDEDEIPEDNGPV